MVVDDIKEDLFDENVIQSKVPVIVDVWAEWCHPCKAYTPVVEAVSKDFDGKVKFFKLNADENERIVLRYNIMSIPTTLLIEKGEIKAMNIGAITKDALKNWITQNL